MKQNAKELSRDLCVIMIAAALALMAMCVTDMISGQAEAHALDYKVKLKSVTPSKGGYKLTWAKPDIKVSGFRIKIYHDGHPKYCYAGGSQTSKIIKYFGKKRINMCDQYMFDVQAYKKTSSGKDWGKMSNDIYSQVNVDIPITEHSDKYWSESIIEDSTKFVYNGKTRKPSVKAIYNEYWSDPETPRDVDTKLTGKDYTVKYSKGRKAIGKYKVKVILKGKYHGSKTRYFYITPKGTSLTSVSASEDGSEGYISVKWKKQTNRTDGYQVWYSENDYDYEDDYEFGSYVEAVKLVKGRTKTSTKITGLKRGYRYQVAVRTYKVVRGKKIYSKWSAPEIVKIPRDE